MRTVFEIETKYSQIVDQLAEKHGVSNLVQIEYSNSLPTMNLDTDVSKAIADFQSDEKKKGRLLVEVGRFMIDEKERGGRLSFVFMEMLNAYFPKNYQFFNSCRTEHKEGYRLVGGETFPKTAPFPTFEWMTNVLLFNREKFAKFILKIAKTRFGLPFWSTAIWFSEPEKPSTFFFSRQNFKRDKTHLKTMISFNEPKIAAFVNNYNDPQKFIKAMWEELPAAAFMASNWMNWAQNTVRSASLFHGIRPIRSIRFTSSGFARQAKSPRVLSQKHLQKGSMKAFWCSFQMSNRGFFKRRRTKSRSFLMKAKRLRRSLNEFWKRGKPRLFWQTRLEKIWMVNS